MAHDCDACNFENLQRTRFADLIGGSKVHRVLERLSLKPRATASMKPMESLVVEEKFHHLARVAAIAARVGRADSGQGGVGVHGRRYCAIVGDTPSDNFAEPASFCLA